MKKLLFIMAAAATLFTACSKEEKNWIDVDHSSDLVGIWTCFEEGFAEALVIKADGSVLSTGYDGEDFWEDVAGNIVVKNGTITMTFEDGDSWEGHFDIVRGVAFSIYTDKGDCLTFNYCKEDLSEEIVGMWVCDQGDNNIAITTYSEDGKMTMTREAYEHSSTSLVNAVSDYRVIGDLRFHIIPEGDAIDGKKPYLVARMVYTPNGTDLGDILTQTLYTPTENGVVEATTSWLRVKEGLNLTEMVYAYKSAYITNVKGKDEDFTMLDHTFNMANIKAADFDIVFGADLYLVELNGNSITHKFRPNGQEIEIVTPISVDGNKVTLDMSSVNPICRKVEMYMFQDNDDTQLHIYMPTSSFINYFANLGIPDLIAEGKLDTTDTAAVEKVFADMEARVESINVSFVMKACK